MQQQIIKDKIIAALNGERIKAAIFYTFNFNPAFFENYIMPIMAPDYEFNNNQIYNAIVWRRVAGDGAIPAVTVYFDDKAKSTQAGPLLDYDLRPIRMRGAFHPKVNLLLTEKKRLIVLVGSNNITQAGWCDNIEGFSVHVLDKKYFFPDNLLMELGGFVEATRVLYDSDTEIYTTAEKEIIRFLNQKGNEEETSFFHSLAGGFSDFLENRILTGNKIDTVEILSPYIAADNELVYYLREKINDVKMLIPVKHTNQVELTKKRFDELGEELVWCTFKDEEIEKYRYNHSKVYRFYSQKKVYTIIGSVNCTNQAWKAKINGGNVEAAILFEEKGNKKILKKYKEDQLGELQFLAENSEREYDGIDIFSPTPEISFTINWKEKHIGYISKWNKRCYIVFSDNLRKSIKHDGKEHFISIKEHKSIILSLARNPIIKVMDSKGTEYLFYPNQIGFLVRPLGFRLSESDIFRMWELFDVKEQANILSLIERYAEKVLKEDGSLDESVIHKEGILNKMAAHISGLLQLNEKIYGEEDKEKRKKNIAYFLTHDNVDTLVNYRNRLKELSDKKELNNGFYWLLLQILKIKFYKRKPKSFNKGGNEDLYRDVQLQIEELDSEIKSVSSKLDIEKKKEHLDWASNYIEKLK